MYLFFSSRMLLTVILTLFVFITPVFKTTQNDYPAYYFLLFIILNGSYAVLYSTQALSKTSFFTKISDKSIGGTYMTLLNTIANIGNHWPITTALYLSDILTMKSCSHDMKIDWVKMNASKKKKMVSFLKTIQENTCSTGEESKVYFLF
jgi:PAT family acetyl-CoA transporter-like MFS transporter 1